jgi:hypothetical protein
MTSQAKLTVVKRLLKTDPLLLRCLVPPYSNAPAFTKHAL